MDLFMLLLIVLVVVVYSWTLYNVPLLVVGIRSSRRGKKHGGKGDSVADGGLPTFSLIIPAKNEALVLPRLFKAILDQDYPEGKVEVLVVEDGSTDGTVQLCQRAAEDTGGVVRLVHADDSWGKPSALNYGLKVAKGDVVGVFDADSIPEPDVLRTVAGYFEDGSVAALQGRTLIANSDVNMLTKFVSYEDAAWCEGYLRGRDALGLFVHLRGSCQFVRREILEVVGGWDARFISDDFELSAKLTERGYRIKYAPEVRSWQESPACLKEMFIQRVRWFRGAMEVALHYGRLISDLNWKTVDAEVMLLGPFVLILSLLGYLMGPLAIVQLEGSLIFGVTVVGWIVVTVSVVAIAMGLLYVAKPKRRVDLLWIPFIYAYWAFLVVLATWALLKIVFNAPKQWKKTSKTGVVTATSVKAEDGL
jgi:cellulose synthase/poly-beta-1,6-N-acetylglucosamine synthase-like glycosyltransferase